MSLFFVFSIKNKEINEKTGSSTVLAANETLPIVLSPILTKGWVAIRMHEINSVNIGVPTHNRG
jgi:hypothetical protein